MNKKKIIAIVVTITVILLGIILGVKNRKQDSYENFVVEQSIDEATKISEGIAAYDDKKWVKLEETEGGHRLEVERGVEIEIPETEYLIKETLKDGDKETISYRDAEDKVVYTVELDYYDAPKLAILIDDVGMNLAAVESFSQIDEPLTFATIPFLPKSREGTEALRNAGFEVILHMPMAGSSDSLNSRTKGILLPTMSKTEIYDTLDRALEDIGKVDGFNNHMGSRFTSNETKMRELLDYANRKDLYFIDSNTAIKNMGYPVSKEIGLPTYYCSHFLDNSRKMEDMQKEIETAVKLAKRNGKALVIGHFHKGMAEAIQAKLNYIEGQGVKLVFASDLLEK